MTHLPFIAAEPDGGDDFFVAQFQKGFNGTGHGLTKHFRLLFGAVGEDIRIVDEGDFHAFESKPLQRILDAPHGGIIRIVEMDLERTGIDPWRIIDGFALCRGQ